MAHFAQLDSNNVVTQVIVVANTEIIDADGVENESIGIAFCESLFGGTWKQTSYNANMRKNYAGIGYMYDPQRDAFIPPKPFNSWVLNEDTCQWQAPVPYPNSEIRHRWDEDTQTWIEDPLPEPQLPTLEELV